MVSEEGMVEAAKTSRTEEQVLELDNGRQKLPPWPVELNRQDEPVWTPISDGTHSDDYRANDALEAGPKPTQEQQLLVEED